MFRNDKPCAIATRQRLPVVVLLATVLLQSATAGQAAPSAIRWIPDDAVIVLEVSRPQALLELLAGPEMTAAVTALPVYEQQVEQPGFKEFLGLIGLLEASLDTDWRTGLAKLTGGGITVAVCPQDTVLLIIDAEDGHMLERLHEILLSFARSEAENQGQPDRVASTQYEGVTAWTFGDGEAHAIIGNRLVLSNRPEGLKAVLQRRAQSTNGGIASNRRFQAAKQAAGSEAIATAFVNLEPLMQIPNIAELLKKGRQNPLAALAFSGIVEAIRSSSWLALGLHVDQDTLTLEASLDGKVESSTSPAAFALPGKPDEGALPNLRVPRRIAALTLYRDLHRFYVAKDELFPERTSGLIFFENMMGIFFSGRDLTNEVLAETKPEVRIVVAEQQYDPAIGSPQVKLPAFAAILRLRDPEHFDAVAEEAWQKAVGLINFTRGQQALPGLIIDRPIHRDTTYTVAGFSTADVADKTRLDQRYNFRPSLALPGDYLILSSTDALARDLIDAVSREMKGPAKPLAGTHSLVELQSGQLASILRSNRETLIRGDMVKKGSTYEQSEAGIDLLITLAGLVDNVKLGIGTREGLTHARLEMKLDLP